MALSETDTIPIPPITPGVARALSPLMRRIACEDESTDAPGLNTYLVGIDEIVIVDPGPIEESHIDVLVGCGGESVRWIVMTDTDPKYSESALNLKEKTGAELIAPVDFPGADQTLGDGFKINATEFRMTAVALDKGKGQNFIFVLEQERTILTGDHIDGSIPEDIKEKVKPYRIKSIAPGHGQFIEDARKMFS